MFLVFILTQHLESRAKKQKNKNKKNKHNTKKPQNLIQTTSHAQNQPSRCSLYGCHLNFSPYLKDWTLQEKLISAACVCDFFTTQRFWDLEYRSTSKSKRSPSGSVLPLPPQSSATPEVPDLIPACSHPAVNSLIHGDRSDEANRNTMSEKKCCITSFSSCKRTKLLSNPSVFSLTLELINQCLYFLPFPAWRDYNSCNSLFYSTEVSSFKLLFYLWLSLNWIFLLKKTLTVTWPRKRFPLSSSFNDFWTSYH